MDRKEIYALVVTLSDRMRRGLVVTNDAMMKVGETVGLFK